MLCLPQLFIPAVTSSTLSAKGCFSILAGIVAVLQACVASLWIAYYQTHSVIDIGTPDFITLSQPGEVTPLMLPPTGQVLFFQESAVFGSHAGPVCCLVQKSLVFPFDMLFFASGFIWQSNWQPIYLLLYLISFTTSQHRHMRAHYPIVEVTKCSSRCYCRSRTGHLVFAQYEAFPTCQHPLRLTQYEAPPPSLVMVTAACGDSQMIVQRHMTPITQVRSYIVCMTLAES